MTRTSGARGASHAPAKPAAQPLHGVVLLATNVTGSASVSVNCPPPIVPAGSSHRFEAIGYANFNNADAAAVPVTVTLSIGEQGGSAPQVVTKEISVAPGASDLDPPLEVEMDLQITPGPHRVRVEIRAMTKDTPPARVAVDWVICNFLAQ